MFKLSACLFLLTLCSLSAHAAVTYKDGNKTIRLTTDSVIVSDGSATKIYPFRQNGSAEVLVAAYRDQIAIQEIQDGPDATCIKIAFTQYVRRAVIWENSTFNLDACQDRFILNDDGRLSSLNPTQASDMPEIMKALQIFVTEDMR